MGFQNHRIIIRIKDRIFYEFEPSRMRILFKEIYPIDVFYLIIESKNLRIML